MQDWGSWCACTLSGGTRRGPSPFRVVPVGLLGAGVVFCCWCIRWSSAMIEATCFSSSRIRFMLVACEESMAFSMHSTCRDSCRIGW
jgi:hypothetical protein